MRGGFGVDQLPGDPNPAAGLPHRTFKDIADAEFAPDLLHIDRLTLVRKARIASDDEEPADATERSNDFFDHSVGEILLLGVAAHILERQHRNRRLIGQWQCGWCGYCLPVWR